tara:strand:- start:223 stop:780 length:558 start_codon:yes stop_codon:yes gene_type:complete
MKKYSYIAFYKPFGVLCQFTTDDDTKTLADFNLPKDVYPAGRLDKDSEGLLFLTDDGIFNQKVANPKSEKEKIYWVQVEKVPTSEDLIKLSKGVIIKGYKTRPCKAKLIESPTIPERVPPIRERKAIPTAWLEMKICEGKNRQVRRMTAAIGFPTLRLIRVGIGKLRIDGMQPGQWKEVNHKEVL